MAKVKNIGLIYKEVGNFAKFKTYEVYNSKGEYLYPTSKDKPLPTLDKNKAFIERRYKDDPEDNPFVSKATGGIKGGAQARFNEAEIIEIRGLIAEGVGNTTISKMYDVAPTTIRDIKLGKSYVGVGTGQ